MLDSLLSVLAPHHCYQCKKPPRLLCEKCINYNTKIYFDGNFIETVIDNKLYKIKYVALRENSLKELVDGFKFLRQKRAYRDLALLLHSVFPQEDNILITTIPTSRSHQRERGYDHMALITKQYAKLCRAKYKNILVGNRKYSQHKMNLQDRQKKAAGVFHFNQIYNTISRDTPIVLVDDIYTTGNTMREAIKALNEAGFNDIRPHVILKQPFDIDQ